MRKGITVILAVVVALAVVIGLTACGGKSKKKLRVGISVGMSPFISIADNKGYFKEADVDIVFENAQDPTTTLNTILLGKLDINTISILPTLSQIAQGTDWIVFAGVRTEGEELIAKAENADKYKDITSLKGTKIAVVHLDTLDFYIKNNLRGKGINPDTDIEFIEVDSHPSVMETVRKGAVDYGICIAEIARVGEKQGLVSILTGGDIAPGYVCCRQVALASDIEANRDTYVKYVKAQIVGYKFFKEEKEETAKYMSNLTGQPVDFYTVNFYGKNAAVLNPEPATKKVKEYYELLKAEGVLTTDVDIEDHLDSSIFRDAIEEIRKEFPNDPTYEALYKTFLANN